MREILFRGKDIISGEWITGFLVDAQHIGDWIESYPIRSDTVGQYTGLSDKNGKKIFEGDIVEVIHEGVYRCRWDEGNCEFGLTNGNESFGIAYVYPYSMVVIGNIHDNPELLGGVDNGN